MTGPLTGIRIIELAGIGPGPFCGMLLADLGADVVRIDRPGGNPGSALGHAALLRNRRTVAMDLKKPEAVAAVLRMCEGADGFFEGFRPGVTERLGVGPDACLARNPKLVYGRMTGWGQEGPLAHTAGHDINYIAIAGALHTIGKRGGGPVIPLNLVGDFGGGGLMLAFGMVCAILEAQRSGKGQVVDAAMVDGASSLMAMWWSQRGQGLTTQERGTNMLDSGAHFYDTYECSDGKHLAVGSIEPQFYAILRDKAGLGPEFANQLNAKGWPDLKDKLAAVVLTKTRDEWAAIFEGTDACVSPVLSPEEAALHPHAVAREAFVQVDGKTQPAPAPRFSRTPAGVPTPASPVGQDTRAVLLDYGFDEAEVGALEAAGAVRCGS
jgi:alpha-methylacyl-CoA racemase